MTPFIGEIDAVKHPSITLLQMKNLLHKNSQLCMVWCTGQTDKKIENLAKLAAYFLFDQ